MYQIRNWSLCKEGEGLAGYGVICEYGYGVEAPTFVSQVVKVEVKNDNNLVRLHIKSGICYDLDFVEIDISRLADTRKAVGEFGICLDIEACLGFRKNIIELLDPCELYVEMERGGAVKKAYFKTTDGEVLSIPPSYLLGMYSDITIIRGCNDGKLFDWCFYPRGNYVECDSWEGIDTVRIKNVSTQDFLFTCTNTYSRDRGDFRYVLCKAGEITVIKEGYTSEASFSDIDRVCFGGRLSKLAEAHENSTNSAIVSLNNKTTRNMEGKEIWEADEGVASPDVAQHDQEKLLPPEMLTQDEINWLLGG